MKKLFFIDTHTHGAYGVDFNYANYDEVKFLLKKLYKKNIRAICPTLTGDNDKNIQTQLSIFKKIKLEQLKQIEEETFIIGAHLEGNFLSKEKAGIQNKKFFKKPNIDNFLKLAGDFLDIIKIVTIAPEEDENLIDYLNKKNIKTQAGHTIGTTLKNCCAVTHLFNAMTQIHHRNPSIALSSLIDDNIYCEIIADLIHLNEDILKLALKAKPLDKILLISDSIPCAYYDKDIIFCSKKINSKGLDESGTLAGSTKTIDEICYNLLKKGLLGEDEINKMAFLNQIKYLNLNNKEIDILNRQ